MTTLLSTNIWNSRDSALDHAKYKPLYAPTAVSWILEYYRDQNRKWNQASEKIPLIVDVACGSGQLSGPLSEHCERLIGVDISQHQVEVARQLNTRPNMEFKVGSATELSAHCPAGDVDLIVVGMAAHYFDNDEFYSEVRRCLRPGGVLAIVSFWYHGIRHDDPQMATVIDRFRIDNAADESIRKTLEKLSDSYHSLHGCPESLLRCPRLKNITMYPEITRKDIRRDMEAIKCLLRDSDACIDRLMLQLPPTEAYSVIQKVFGLFYMKEFDHLNCDITESSD